MEGRIDNLCLEGRIDKLCLGGRIDNLCLVGRINNLCLGGRIDNLCLEERIDNLCLEWWLDGYQQGWNGDNTNICNNDKYVKYRIEERKQTSEKETKQTSSMCLSKSEESVSEMAHQ